MQVTFFRSSSDFTLNESAPIKRTDMYIRTLLDFVVDLDDFIKYRARMAMLF